MQREAAKASGAAPVTELDRDRALAEQERRKRVPELVRCGDERPDQEEQGGEERGRLE
jgi:hypothetical protein